MTTSLLYEQPVPLVNYKENLEIYIKVRDTIEEVNVNGFLMNNIKFMPTMCRNLPAMLAIKMNLVQLNN